MNEPSAKPSNAYALVDELVRHVSGWSGTPVDKVAFLAEFCAQLLGRNVQVRVCQAIEEFLSEPPGSRVPAELGPPPSLN